MNNENYKAKKRKKNGIQFSLNKDFCLEQKVDNHLQIGVDT